jgi:hypothetical protein
MNVFQAVGLFLGIVAGAVVGAMLCSGRGTLACVGGATGGSFVGLIAGTLLVTLLWYPCCLAYAFLRAVAQIYWELLTGRRKLPSSSTRSERRQLLIFIVLVFAVAMTVLAGVYLFGSDAQRARLLWAAVAIFTTCAVGLLILNVHHRRHPARGATGQEE